LGVELDLDYLALTMNGAEYEPAKFPGLVFRLKSPKTATLLFRSGKLVCCGSRSIEMANRAVEAVAAHVRNAGICIDDSPKTEIQNIVASADVGHPLNLNAIAISLGMERVEYEPEVFPGLVYRLDEPKAVILLFGSGKLVCAGARKPQDIEAAVDQMTGQLLSMGLLDKSA